jgi:hypothetical protein
VDAGIGASRAGDLDRVAQVSFQGGHQRPAHGGDPRLDGKAVETGPKVGDVEADPNRRAFDDGRRRCPRLIAEEGQR